MLLEILASNLYTQREIEDLLRTVQGVLGSFVCPDIGWLDVMIPVLPKESDRPRLLIQQGEMGDVWLKVLYSAIRRTTRPTLIPTQVNLRPWRGSGNAYLSSGIDFVSSFQGRLAFVTTACRAGWPSRSSDSMLTGSKSTISQRCWQSRSRRREITQLGRQACSTLTSGKKIPSAPMTRCLRGSLQRCSTSLSRRFKFLRQRYHSTKRKRKRKRKRKSK